MASREYRYVTSSNIQGVSYDRDTQTLYVQFKNGSEYSYASIPSDEYEELISATSVGSYFNDNIKGQYAFTRV